MIWIGTLAALAAQDDGFAALREENGCRYSTRPADHPSGSAMRAVCTWDDVDPVALDRKMADFASYDEMIWVVDVSEVRRTDDGRALVYQLQKLWGLNDREVLLWAWSEEVEGGHRHRWSTASEEPLAPRKGTIRTPRNEGYWEVRANPAGPGAIVTHQIGVDAGGIPLPGWLLRWIRNNGFQRVMDEVRHPPEAG